MPAAESEPAPMRIACSGIVAAEYGSTSSANFEILRELLRRGHRIEFFSTKSYVYPQGLIERDGLEYVDCSAPRVEAIVRRLGDGPAGWVGSKLAHQLFTRRIMRAMRHRHSEERFDIELFLGLWAFGRIADLTVVSWVQGPPGTDARSIRRHRGEIIRLCGAREYVLLRAYARFRTTWIGRPAFRHTDIYICGSRDSERTMIDRFGVAAERVHALPYPVDLGAFAPAAARPSGGRPELLWVGRVVPRKRLDLFLDAAALLIENGWDVELTMIGGFAFAAGYGQLIEEFPHPDRLTHVPHMPRDEVRARLQSATVLVQPSEEENFGSSVAEALACGTPVVVGPTNGTGDYIGTGGEQFSEYTAGAVAAAIARVLHDSLHEPARRRQAARNAAVDALAVERVTDDLEAILRSARSLPAGGDQPRAEQGGLRP